VSHYVKNKANEPRKDVPSFVKEFTTMPVGPGSVKGNTKMTTRTSYKSLRAEREVTLGENKPVPKVKERWESIKAHPEAGANVRPQIVDAKFRIENQNARSQNLQSKKITRRGSAKSSASAAL
jgi:hypothetical protein